MEDTLRISLVQADLLWEKPARNRKAFAERLKDLKGKTDLVVLPEMFTTGFTMEAAKYAERMSGPTVQWMRRQAEELGAVLTGSLIIREKGYCYNRLVWMRPDGTYSWYDKKHLFTLAGEDEHYTPGRRHLFAQIGEWTVLPLICYDLRFPAWSRSKHRYDLLLYVANFPAARSHAWNTLLPARAIENVSYVAGVNRVGTDGKDIYYQGDSSLYDFAGKQIYRCTDREDIFTTTLHRSELLSFRAKFPFLEDADKR